jgi:hypothetical protein
MTLYGLRRFLRRASDNVYMHETAANKVNVLEEYFEFSVIIWNVLDPIAFTNTS